MIRKVLIISALAVGLLAVPAWATNIEFTGAPYSNWTNHGPHKYSGTEGGIGFTLEAFKKNGQKNAFLGFKKRTVKGVTAVGIGVHGGWAGNEIGRGEQLSFALDGGQAVYLSSFTVNFLYREYTNRPPCKQHLEGLKYSVDEGLTWQTVFQNDPTQTFPKPFTSGAMTVNLSGLGATSLLLRSSGMKDHDFVLNTVRVAGAETPEPATLLLFGSVLAGGAFLRRRRRA